MGPEYVRHLLQCAVGLTSISVIMRISRKTANSKLAENFLIFWLGLQFMRRKLNYNFSWWARWKWAEIYFTVLRNANYCLDMNMTRNKVKIQFQLAWNQMIFCGYRGHSFLYVSFSLPRVLNFGLRCKILKLYPQHFQELMKSYQS